MTSRDDRVGGERIYQLKSLWCVQVELSVGTQTMWGDATINARSLMSVWFFWAWTEPVDCWIQLPALDGNDADETEINGKATFCFIYIKHSMWFRDSSSHDFRSNLNVLLEDTSAGQILPVMTQTDWGNADSLDTAALLQHSFHNTGE